MLNAIKAQSRSKTLKGANEIVKHARRTWISKRRRFSSPSASSVAVSTRKRRRNICSYASDARIFLQKATENSDDSDEDEGSTNEESAVILGKDGNKKGKSEPYDKAISGLTSESLNCTLSAEGDVTGETEEVLSNNAAAAPAFSGNTFNRPNDALASAFPFEVSSKKNAYNLPWNVSKKKATIHIVTPGSRKTYQLAYTSATQSPLRAKVKSERPAARQKRGVTPVQQISRHERAQRRASNREGSVIGVDGTAGEAHEPCNLIDKQPATGRQLPAGETAAASQPIIATNGAHNLMSDMESVACPQEWSTGAPEGTELIEDRSASSPVGDDNEISRGGIPLCPAMPLLEWAQNTLSSEVYSKGDMRTSQSKKNPRLTPTLCVGGFPHIAEGCPTLADIQESDAVSHDSIAVPATVTVIVESQTAISQKGCHMDVSAYDHSREDDSRTGRKLL